MKLRGRTKPTEQRLRHAVEAAGGAVEMRVSALLLPHGVKTPSTDALAGLEQSLTEAGLIVTPPLGGCGWDDLVSVALSNGHVVEQPSNGEVGAEEPETIQEPVPDEEPANTELSEEEAMKDAASLVTEPTEQPEGEV